jgi:hypothetical protein
MFRFLALALLLATGATLAQTAPVPITGRVLNKEDGQPIAGATVHYRGEGNVTDSQGRPAAPPTLQGEVTTGPDGTYSTPPLPAFGDFALRASAPGFFSAKDYLQALPVTIRNIPAPLFAHSRPPGAPSHDGTLRLLPDPVNLQPMSDAALVAFRMPLTIMANRSYVAASFSSDGNHLGFITFDTLAVVGKSITRSCKLWSYDLQTGALTGVNLPGSPHQSDMKTPDPAPGFCTAGDTTGLGTGFYLSGYAIAWDGPVLYAVNVEPQQAAPSAPPASAAYVLHQSTLESVVPSDQPPAVKAVIAEESRVRQLSSTFDAASAASTTDGLFTVHEDFDDTTGRGSCSKLVVLAKNSHNPKTVIRDCPGFTWRLDPARDLLLYTQPRNAPYPDNMEDLVEVDLKTLQTRAFGVPSMNYEPELLAEQPLSTGSIRLAYTIRGDCDFAASDYSQPGQPDGVLGNTPNQFSVCFITLPAQPAP